MRENRFENWLRKRRANIYILWCTLIVLFFVIDSALAFTLVASLLGGLLTLALLSLRQLPLPANLARLGWILKLHEESSGIPYGVALAAGALVILPHAEILKLAASV